MSAAPTARTSLGSLRRGSRNRSLEPKSAPSPITLAPSQVRVAPSRNQHAPSCIGLVPSRP
jgi:hypothetical protein